MKFQSKAAFVPQQLGANIWYKMVQDWHNLQTHTHTHTHTVVSINGGTPKSSIIDGFSLINYPCWGAPMAMDTWTPCFHLPMFPITVAITVAAAFQAFVEAVLPGDVSPGAVQAALYVQGLRYHSSSDETGRAEMMGVR